MNNLRRHWKIVFAVALVAFVSAVLAGGGPGAPLPQDIVPMIASPTPTATPFIRYIIPKIPNKEAYTIVLVGDSMTAALGPHPFRLSQLLNERYHQKAFAIDNYSQGSASILDLEKLLTEKTQLNGRQEKPALERDFDILIIESFGNNPLSHLPLEEGLRKQEETMDKIMVKLIATHPQAVIIALGTIAPSEQRYAQGVLDLPSDLRASYARERRRYIENFIEYAHRREIPVIDLYHQTLNPDGTAKHELINPDDNIHPSQTGVELIQRKIADFLFEQNLLPY